MKNEECHRYDRMTDLTLFLSNLAIMYCTYRSDWRFISSDINGSFSNAIMDNICLAKLLKSHLIARIFKISSNLQTD